jgi:hypothetical protein
MKTSLSATLLVFLVGACEQKAEPPPAPAEVLQATTGTAPKAEANAEAAEGAAERTDGAVVPSATTDGPASCENAVGLRSKCEKKQATRKAGCAEKPEADRAMCEHDADLLMKACSDLPEVAEDLFCASGSDAKCTKRTVKASDRVAGKACAGGQVCTAPGFICDVGTLWDCVCGNVYYPRSGNCGCECVD